ncbi:MAG: hypothetical protein CVU03_12275 [Bacteroidetes bacterium HGW-Bacteroidetes-2]|jgi:hypothetical protein|nr:MAG: hypothetical protein CVU03_12275 [Bacteroidetes bacterium HGW-Bacteroidetes-2]
MRYTNVGLITETLKPYFLKLILFKALNLQCFLQTECLFLPIENGCFYELYSIFIYKNFS